MSAKADNRFTEDPDFQSGLHPQHYAHVNTLCHPLKYICPQAARTFRRTAALLCAVLAGLRASSPPGRRAG